MGSLATPGSSIQLTHKHTDGLKSKGRHAEAGRVLLEYGRNVKAAVYALSEGALFAEALRLVRY